MTWEGVGVGRGVFISSVMDSHGSLSTEDHGPLSPRTLPVLYTPTAAKSFVLCLANKTALGESSLSKHRNSPEEWETQSETWHCCYDHSAVCGFPLGLYRIWQPPEPQHPHCHSHPPFVLHHLPALPLPLLTMPFPSKVPFPLDDYNSSPKNSIKTFSKPCRL